MKVRFSQEWASSYRAITQALRKMERDGGPLMEISATKEVGVKPDHQGTVVIGVVKPDVTRQILKPTQNATAGLEREIERQGKAEGAGWVIVGKRRRSAADPKTGRVHRARIDLMRGERNHSLHPAKDAQQKEKRIKRGAQQRKRSLEQKATFLHMQRKKGLLRSRAGSDQVHQHTRTIRGLIPEMATQRQTGTRGPANRHPRMPHQERRTAHRVTDGHQVHGIAVVLPPTRGSASSIRQHHQDPNRAILLPETGPL